MLYEAMITGARVEFVDAHSKEEAILKAHCKCEEREVLIYIREKDSYKMVWVFSSCFHLA